MQHNWLSSANRHFIVTSLLTISISGAALAQGFPMMAPGLPGMGFPNMGLGQSLPGMGQGLPGMGQGLPGMGKGFPGTGMHMPNTDMKFPEFGKAFPGLNMTTPNGNNNAPQNYRSNNNNWSNQNNRNFPSPFNSSPGNNRNNGSALYDLKFYRPDTREAARMIVQARMQGQNLMVRQCTQRMPQKAMFCQTYINGRPSHSNWVRAPHENSAFQAPSPDKGIQMQGTGTWQGTQVIGTFQYRFNTSNFIR